MTARSTTRSTRSVHSPASRRGLSLLEVMLAIAILGGTIAVLGELVRTGSTAAAGCEKMTTAQMLAESLINEVVIGMRPMSDGQGIFPDYPEWTYTLTMQPSDQDGVLVVIGTVAHQDPDGAGRPFTYQLFRWVIDPILKYPPEDELLEEEEAAVEAAL